MLPLVGQDWRGCAREISDVRGETLASRCRAGDAHCPHRGNGGNNRRRGDGRRGLAVDEPIASARMRDNSHGVFSAVGESRHFTTQFTIASDGA